MFVPATWFCVHVAITVVSQRITFHVYDLVVEGVGHQWSFLALLEKAGILW